MHTRTGTQAKGLRVLRRQSDGALSTKPRLQTPVAPWGAFWNGRSPTAVRPPMSRCAPSVSLAASSFRGKGNN